MNMNRLKIGIHLESLGLPLRGALREAQRLGVRGVQADALGELSPHSLSQTGRTAFRRLLQSHNLELTALGCPLRRGLDSPEDQQQRIDHTKAVLGLSVDLGARIAIVQELYDRVAASSDAETLARCERNYLISSRYEWWFWDTAYRRREWPV